MAIRDQALPTAQTRVADTAPKRKTNYGAIGRYIAVAIVLFIALAPFYWTAITSIKVDSEINTFRRPSSRSRSQRTTILRLS